jgi:hypothetical protein
MTVTHEAGRSIQMTAAGDQYPQAIWVKRIRLEGAADTDALEITDPDDNNLVMLAHVSDGTPLDLLIEQYWHNGFEANVLAGGILRVYYE